MCGVTDYQFFMALNTHLDRKEWNQYSHLNLEQLEELKYDKEFNQNKKDDNHKWQKNKR